MGDMILDIFTECVRNQTELKNMCSNFILGTWLHTAAIDLILFLRKSEFPRKTSSLILIQPAGDTADPAFDKLVDHVLNGAPLRSP